MIIMLGIRVLACLSDLLHLHSAGSATSSVHISMNSHLSNHLDSRQHDFPFWYSPREYMMPLQLNLHFVFYTQTPQSSCSSILYSSDALVILFSDCKLTYTSFFIDFLIGFNLFIILRCWLKFMCMYCIFMKSTELYVAWILCKQPSISIFLFEASRYFEHISHSRACSMF